MTMRRRHPVPPSSLFTGVLVIAFVLCVGGRAEATPPVAQLSLAKRLAPSAMDVIRVRRHGLTEIDLLDLDERAAMLRVEQSVERGSVMGAARALGEYQARRSALDQLRAELWSSLDTRGRVDPALIQEPMTLALLDMHVELRRRLGARLRTVVPELNSQPACQGDLIEERLIYGYASALDRAKSSTVAQALTLLALNVACLEDRHLAQLERALAESFETVATRMSLHDAARLVEPFAQTVAPLMVLIYDVRKVRGSQSYLYHWFDLWGDALERGVAMSGWPTKHLYVWNGRAARLNAFPTCAQGPASGPCVQWASFLAWLRDPHAIGPGDCGFAKTIALTPARSTDVTRYACAPSKASSAESSPALEVCLARNRPAAQTAYPQSQTQVDSAWWSELANAVGGFVGRDEATPEQDGANHQPKKLPRGVTLGMYKVLKPFMEGVQRAEQQCAEPTPGTTDAPPSVGKVVSL